MNPVKSILNVCAEFKLTEKICKESENLVKTGSILH